MFDFSKLTGNWALDTYQDTQKWIKDSMVRETKLQTDIRFLESVPDSTGHRQPVLLSTNLANKDYPTRDSTSRTAGGVAIPVFIPPNTQHAQFVPLIDQNQVSSYLAGLDNIVSVTPNSALKNQWGMLFSTDPRQILHSIWSIISSTFGYVIWNYEDFARQFQSWDGSVNGLLRHMGLLWRTMITIFITLGILELGPLIDGLSRIFMEIGELVVFMFRLVETTANEMWYFLNLLWEDLMIPVKWLMQSKTN